MTPAELCTCDKDSDTRAADCPTHGLATIEVPSGLREYRYTDGIVVHASSEADADSMHVRMLARRSRS